jgi:phosphomannomutase
MAADYTFDNVRRVAQGFASYLQQQGLAGKGVVIGHDRRFQARDFAKATAEVLAANGIHVWLTEDATPTPTISFSVVDKGAGGAVNITASHNPPEDCGFKVRDPQGGAIPPEQLKQIEELIPPAMSDVRQISLDDALSDGNVEVFDPAPAYIALLQKLVDFQPLKDAGYRVLVDCMWGNGAGWFPRLLGGGKTEIIEVHNEHNPLFPTCPGPSRSRRMSTTA